MRMLEELTKGIKFGEKKIEDNKKKVETYNSRVDQIPGAPPVLKGLDAKKFIQKPFPPSEAMMPIPKKFCMPDIPKYNGTTDPNEHITSYTCGIKGNDLNDDEIEGPRLSEYNFNIDASGIVSTIGRIKDTKWPRPIQTDPSQRNPNLMCKYHGTHGHRTEDCRNLREEVAWLFNEGHLRKFLSDRAKNHFRERDVRKNEQEEPQHVIHIIISGVDVPQRPVFKRTKVSITREKLTRSYVPEVIFSFCDEEAEGISQPHNDALVISILLNKIQVKCVFVDPGISVNIIRLRIVEQLSLQDQILPVSRVLNGFNMESETTKGEIILPVNVAGTIQDMKFHVIKGDMRYNALLERPWIHNMRAVPSTLHQMMKLPKEEGVKKVYEEQHAAKEIFAIEEVVPALEPSTSEKSSTKDKQAAE
ncbi:uncharacterized protein [Nicotiana sylvestris]|uniref:uncharacterized protein n=1 Tax=Nicotiana sylvestris TaxID=4096 RepID=UPI00388C3BB0